MLSVTKLLIKERVNFEILIIVETTNVKFQYAVVRR